MRNSVSRRGALASGAGALIGLLAAKARAAGADGDDCFRYDDFPRPDAELGVARDACQRATKYCYDGEGMLISVVEQVDGDVTVFTYDGCE